MHINQLAIYARRNEDKEMDREEDNTAFMDVETIANEPLFADFLVFYPGNQKAGYSATTEQHLDLFEVPEDYAFVHCVATDFLLLTNLSDAVEARKNW